jgi:taurine dioxygenase
MSVTTALAVEEITPAVGAVASGVDLRAVDEATIAAIRAAVLRHGALFFRDQVLTREQTLEFMSEFGEPCLDPFAAVDVPVPPEFTVIYMVTKPTARATAVWHIDSSLAPEPASFISLRPIELPPSGGDTCWASMYAAYDALSPALRTMLDGLSAVHSSFKVMPLMSGADYGTLDEGMRNVHPVVRVHPETGRKALFVDELWTERIVELEAAESDALLGFLYEHIRSPLFTMRWHWRLGDIVVWDNQAFQHYAVNDYEGTRVLQKSLVAGERPYGPQPA